MLPTLLGSQRHQSSLIIYMNYRSPCDREVSGSIPTTGLGACDNYILMGERMSLNNQSIYQFFCNFFLKIHYLKSSPKVEPVPNALRDDLENALSWHLLNTVIVSISAEKATLENAKEGHEMLSIFNRIAWVRRGEQNRSLQYILQVCRDFQHQRDAEAASEVAQKDLDKSLECQTSTDDKATSRRRGTASQGSQESSDDTGTCHLF
ncbi:hypothetical protein DPMN_087001 [Dreissena polymorpha]|uniref:Uncharacterized protein n=1 Tax=Dreissena polymorpha TaxID=45954 RepID=A0A9D4QV74_DREPO|nr:hypothetical protein DPMN_087001 [Dreissena polymorpha]